MDDRSIPSSRPPMGRGALAGIIVGIVAVALLIAAFLVGVIWLVLDIERGETAGASSAPALLLDRAVIVGSEGRPVVTAR